MVLTTESPKTKSKAIIEKIPDYLIYEMSKGKPIYYKGYRDVVAGKKSKEEIMGDSTLQGWLKTRLGHILLDLLETKGYDIIVGELGIKMEEKGWRNADCAIFKIEDLVLNKKYAEKAPEIIIEIDVQADTKNIGDDMKYIREKMDEYFSKGVKKIIWIFTESETVVTAVEPGKWTVENWDKDVEIMSQVSFNIFKLLEKRR